MHLIRRADGLSLIELMIAVVVSGMIGTVTVRMLLGAGRTSRALHSRVAAQAALDGATGFLAGELALVGRDSAGSDFLAVARESLSYRAVRASGLACLVSATEIRIAVTDLAGIRQPQAGRDSLLLLVLDDSTGVASWLPAPVTSVSGTWCGAEPALSAGTVLDTAIVHPSRLPPRVPLRFFEVMQGRLYQSLGQYWLGARSISAGELIQPLAGPFAAGSHFDFRDSVGGPTTVPVMVRSVELHLAAPWTGWSGSPAAENTAVTLSAGSLLP